MREIWIYTTLNKIIILYIWWQYDNCRKISFLVDTCWKGNTKGHYICKLIFKYWRGKKCMLIYSEKVNLHTHTQGKREWQMQVKGSLMFLILVSQLSHRFKTFQNKKLGWVKEEPEWRVKERNLSHNVFLNTREDGGSNEWDSQSISFPDSIWKEVKDQ